MVLDAHKLIRSHVLSQKSKAEQQRYLFVVPVTVLCHRPLSSPYRQLKGAKNSPNCSSIVYVHANAYITQHACQQWQIRVCGVKVGQVLCKAGSTVVLL